MKRIKQRLIWLAILAAVICAGLFSRNIKGGIAEMIDLKDVFWALMVYLLIRIIFIDWSIMKAAVTCLIFSFLIEISQLYHAEWIDELRSTYLGAIVLGTSFVWSDLPAYCAGTGLGIVIDYLLGQFRTDQHRLRHR